MMFYFLSLLEIGIDFARPMNITFCILFFFFIFSSDNLPLRALSLENDLLVKVNAYHSNHVLFV